MKSTIMEWTNRSVRDIAQLGDPIVIIVKKARSLVFDALQKGWSGPPYDPFELAELLRIDTTPNSGVLDAKISTKGSNRFSIEYNPNQPTGRIRYSIAHEIAHTLFPDCREFVRMRQKCNFTEEDNWQLEMLCNLAAAELLMPIGSFFDLKDESLNIDTLMEWRKKFNVSTEAILLRAIKLTNQPCFMFTCSRHKENTNSPIYFLDYSVPSKSFYINIKPNIQLPIRSCVNECTAIGFTAKEQEEWPAGIGEIEVECVGLPAYPNHIYPRVAGIGLPTKQEVKDTNEIKYIKGDATKPRGDEKKVLAFIINDKANSWGAGFAKQMQKKWPLLLEEFKYWKTAHKHEFQLGNIHTSRLESDLTAVLMVAQHGYGASKGPRVRYEALENTLRKVAKEAEKTKASVHMPRIGAGQAGGNWTIIEELIEKELCQKGLKVTVYDLPNTKTKKTIEEEKLLFS